MNFLVEEQPISHCILLAKNKFRNKSSGKKLSAQHGVLMAKPSLLEL
jgi:hypothetical protein